MVYHDSFTLLTSEYNSFIVITDQVIKAIDNSGISTGVVHVISNHTTTGITVNESLECLESDLDMFLKRLVPEDYPYSHARMLKNYGSTAGNPTGHIKSHITGNNCVFPVINGNLARGGAQEIYFCDFDGPASRKISIVVLGE